MRKASWWIALVLAVGCAKLPRSQRSQDGTLEVMLPAGWAPAVLNGPGKIQAASSRKNAYALVVSEAKVDFAKLDTLDAYASFVLDLEQKKTKMPDRTISAPEKIKVNGKDALRYEVHGTLNNVRFVFVKTFIESGTHWNQVSCWTTPSHLDESRPDFEAIVSSFRDLSPPAK
jgi:hypothetical protein